MSFDQQNKNRIGCYIINLDNCQDRLAYTQKSVAPMGLNTERVPAINGKNLTLEEIEKKVDLYTYKKTMGHIPKFGTIGASLSHIKAWQTFLESNYEYALIFEDDVSFDYVKLVDTIQQLMNCLPLWDIVSFNIMHHGFPLRIKKLQGEEKLVVYLTEIASAGALLVSRKAAQKLYDNALPIIMPIDYYFTNTWNLNLIFAGIEPRIVKQTFGTTDILHTPRPTIDKNVPLLKIKRTAYKLGSYIIRFLYNLKIYLWASFIR
jgi:glycosyl transferase, family 25